MYKKKILETCSRKVFECIRVCEGLGLGSEFLISLPELCDYKQLPKTAVWIWN